ncbi:hypothetical protein JMUB6875_67320 [Nocardia sp. JMUB6875]|uniref:hypothetical protein n=1 Tax=Nocardia sp. JMUB6875 TaxID=3158170 RepID=UPI0032E68BF6
MSQDTDQKRAVEPETSTVSESTVKPEQPAAKTVSLKLSTLLTAAAGALLVAALVTVTVLWQSARSDLKDRDAQLANDKHAEQVATDYAMGTATVDYSDFNAWLARLKNNTTPKLAGTFDAARNNLQALVVPMKWNSSPTFLSSQVVNRDNGVYKVNVFLNVNTTTTQTPDGGLATVYYTVTVDPKSDWKVADVGGSDLRLPKQ